MLGSYTIKTFTVYILILRRTSNTVEMLLETNNIHV